MFTVALLNIVSSHRAAALCAGMEIEYYRNNIFLIQIISTCFNGRVGNSTLSFSISLYQWNIHRSVIEKRALEPLVDSRIIIM